MQLLKTLSLLATAAVALAENRLTFISQDKIDRTIYFTPSVPHEQVPPLRVKGLQEESTVVPYGWIGNFWAVADGEPVRPGMLGEVTFQGFEGKTFFDVSAIVDERAEDLNGVKTMYPASSKAPTSGCHTFPCSNAYYLPDDVQTKVTPDTHIVTTLGTPNDFPRGWDWLWERDNEDESDCECDEQAEPEFKKRSVEEETFPHAAVLGQWPRT